MNYVSIIIPTHNQSARLKVVLESLKEQNFDKLKYEVVVVNDGSTDDTESVVNNLKKKYKLLYKKHNTNLGRAIARNSGSEMANGGIIIFLDGDRIPGKNFINEHLNFHRNNDNTVVIGNTLELFTSNIESNGEKILKDFNENENKILKKCRYFNYAECVINLYDKKGKTNSGLAWLTLFSGNFSINRLHFNNIGKFDSNYKTWGFENFDLGYRLLKNNFKFRYNKNAYNIHLFHENNRKSVIKNESYNYFYNKFKSEDIKKLIPFLKGEISLQELESYCINYERVLNIDKPITFISSKYGKRFEI